MRPPQFLTLGISSEECPLCAKEMPGGWGIPSGWRLVNQEGQGMLGGWDSRPPGERGGTGDVELITNGQTRMTSIPSCPHNEMAAKPLHYGVLRVSRSARILGCWQVAQPEWARRSTPPLHILLPTRLFRAMHPLEQTINRGSSIALSPVSHAGQVSSTGAAPRALQWPRLPAESTVLGSPEGRLMCVGELIRTPGSQSELS